MAGEGLLAALQAAQYRAADNPYGIAAQSIAAGTPALVNPYASTGANFGSVVGAGLLSALLAGLARNSANDSNAELLPIQTKLLAAPAEERAAILQSAGDNASRLSPLAAALAQQDYLDKAAINQEVNKAKALLPIEEAKAGSAAATDLLKQGGYAVTGGQLVKVLDPIAQAEAETAAKARGEASAKGAAGLSPNELTSTVKGYDSDIAGDPAARAFVEVKSQVNALQDALKSGDPVAAKGVLYLMAKAIDPSVVKGNELDFWKSSGGLSSKAEQAILDLENGKIRSETVKGFEDLSNTLLKSRYNSYKEMFDTRNQTLANLLKTAPDQTGLTAYGNPIAATQTPTIDPSAAIAELKRRGKL